MKLFPCGSYIFALLLIFFTSCSTHSLVQDSAQSVAADTTVMISCKPARAVERSRRGLITGLLLGTFTGVTGAVQASSFIESEDNTDKAKFAATGALVGFPVGFLIGSFLGTKVSPKPQCSPTAPDSLK